MNYGCLMKMLKKNEIEVYDHIFMDEIKTPSDLFYLLACDTIAHPNRSLVDGIRKTCGNSLTLSLSLITIPKTQIGQDRIYEKKQPWTCVPLLLLNGSMEGVLFPNEKKDQEHDRLTFWTEVCTRLATFEGVACPT